jgi:hypothetical protein
MNGRSEPADGRVTPGWGADEGRADEAAVRAYRTELAGDLERLAGWLAAWSELHDGTLDALLGEYGDTLTAWQHQAVEEALEHMGRAVLELSRVVQTVAEAQAAHREQVWRVGRDGDEGLIGGPWS